MATTIVGAPSHQIIRLGGELRVLRLDRNLKQGEIADALTGEPSVKTTWSESKISRIERAKLLLTPAELSDLLDFFRLDHDERADLEQLLTGVPSKRWWREFDDSLSPAMAEYLGFESEATETWEYPGCSTVPGMGQTDEVATQMIQEGIDSPGADHIEAGVKIRLLRQRRLTQQPLLIHTAYFSEIALMLITRPLVLAGQLRKLLDFATYPNVTLRMVPIDAGRQGILASGLTLVRFADPEAPKFAFVEAVGGTMARRSGREVRHAERAFARLAEAALSPEDTIVALKKKLEQLS